MRGSVWIEKRILRPSKKHAKGRTRYYVFSEVNGVRRSHGGHDILRDAQAAKRIIDGQLANDTFGKPERENPLLDDYYVDWWKSKKHSLGPSANRSYASSFRLYILPFFRKKRLADITPREVQSFIDSLNDLSPNYTKTIYAHFRACMNTAVDLEYTDRSPCRGITLPRVPHKKKKYLGAEDTWKLIAACDAPFDTLFTVLALSGIRIGECLALRVRSIDFEAGKIRVEETWDNESASLHEPKSKTSMRNVEMMDCLSEVLRCYLRASGNTDPDAFLFPSPYMPNRPRSYITVHDRFHKARKMQGLPHCTIHSLRHSFASIMIASGVSIPTLARNLGHSSPVITMGVYAHEIEEMVGPALQRADAVFRAARETAIGAGETEHGEAEGPGLENDSERLDNIDADRP